MVGSSLEPEWDEAERQWMLALQAWRDQALCPLCGWPKEVCQDPLAEWKFEAQATRCQITTILRRQQEAARQGTESTQPAPYQDAVLWSVTPKQ